MAMRTSPGCGSFATSDWDQADSLAGIVQEITHGLVFM